MTKKTEQMHTMTIVSKGANHGLMFASAAATQAAYKAIKDRQQTVVIESLASDPPPAKTLPLIEVKDDFGTTVMLDVREVHSFRFTDVAEEHRGGGELKLVEIQSALSFEKHVQENHPALYAQRGGTGKIWTPGNRN